MQPNSSWKMVLKLTGAQNWWWAPRVLKDVSQNSQAWGKHEITEEEMHSLSKLIQPFPLQSSTLQLILFHLPIAPVPEVPILQDNKNKTTAEEVKHTCMVPNYILFALNWRLPVIKWEVFNTCLWISEQVSKESIHLNKRGSYNAK